MANLIAVENKRFGTGATIARFTILRNGRFADPPVDIPGSTKTEMAAGNQHQHVGSSGVRWLTPTGLKLYAISAGIVYSSDDDGVTWVTEFTPTGTRSPTHTNFVHVTGSDGVAYLVYGAWLGTTLAYCRFDGTTWVQDNFAVGNTRGVLFAHQGLVHLVANSVIGSAGGATNYYDPATRATVNPAGGPPAQQGQRLATHFTIGRRLFIAATTTVDGTNFLEFTLGSWVQVGAVPFLTYVGDASSSIRRGIAVHKLADGTALLFGSGDVDANGTAGLECAHLRLVAGVLSATRVTDTVVPPLLRATGPGDGDDYVVMACSAHEPSDPLNPRRLLYLATDSDATVSWNLLEIFDENTQAEILGLVGVTTIWDVPGIALQSGLFQFTPGQTAVQVVSVARDAQGLRIVFRAGGDPGNANKVIRFLYDNGIGQPDTYCTLVPGTEVGGGTVDGGAKSMSGVDADPSILHEVVWDFLADGITDASYDALESMISTS